MTCPLCKKRKARRLCPARAESICSICCGTEREVSIDCPSECEYLIASRQYDRERSEIELSKLPFPQTKVSATFLRDHEGLFAALEYALCEFAAQHPEVVDADALAVLQTLAEGYQTLANGIYYEKPLTSPRERALSDRLKVAVQDLQKEEARRVGVPTLRNSDLRDALIYLTQLGATCTNGRPKGRAFLDHLRGQFRKETFPKPLSNLLVLP